MESEIAKIYGNQVRIRVCGLCRDGDKLLLVNHKGLSKGDFWAPPGGGVEFGEPIAETLKREFLEETNLHIAVGPFAFGCEFLASPLHAIELFFEVSIVGGVLTKGNDPELAIITDIGFFSPAAVAQKAPNELHGIFQYYTASSRLSNLTGFYKI